MRLVAVALQRNDVVADVFMRNERALGPDHERFPDRMTRPVTLAVALLLAACGDGVPLVPTVDLILLPPVGAAAAGAPETPDFPPPDDELEESEPSTLAHPVEQSASEPLSDADAAAEPHADPDAEPDADAAPEPTVDAEQVAPAASVAPVADGAPAPEPAPAASLAPRPSHRTVAGAGFSYAIPAAWRELDASSLGVPTMVTAQRATAPIDGFVTNVNVAVERFDGDGVAYGHVHAAAIAEGDALRDMWLATLHARPALDVEGVWTNLGGVPYFTLQRYAADGRHGYVITCAASVTAYEAERTLCEDVLATFDVE